MEAKLALKTACNNGCIFCGNSRAKGVDASGAEKKLEELRAQGESLAILGGEPTILPKLPAIISLAKKTGFKKITLNTNARMLCNLEYAEQLSKAGLSQINATAYSHDPKVHDEITRCQNSLKQAVMGIKNAQRAGIETRATIPLLSQNKQSLGETAFFLQNLLGIRRIAICATKANCGNKIAEPLNPKEATQAIFQIKPTPFSEITLSGFPFCTIQEFKDFLWEPAFCTKKQGRCVGCLYEKACPGLETSAGKRDFACIRPLKAEFQEVKIGFSGIVSNAELNIAKKLLDQMLLRKIPKVKFTGEPMAVPGIEPVFAYAKKLGFTRVIETKGNASAKQVERLGKYATHILYLLETPSEEEKEKLSRNSRALGKLRERGIILVARTPAFGKTKIELNFDDCAEALKSANFGWWRIMPPENQAQLTETAMEQILYGVRKSNEFGLRTYLAHEFPLCASDPLEMLVASECKFTANLQTMAVEIGEEKITANPGNIACESVGEVWNHPIYQSRETFEMLPQACKDCNLLSFCRGGSRDAAFAATGKLDGMDPLAKPAEFKEEFQQ